MNDARLLPTLAGSFAGRPTAWRRHVNAHVFFWAEERRRDAFMRACMRLRGRSGTPPRVLAIDSAHPAGTSRGECILRPDQHGVDGARRRPCAAR